MVPKIVRIYNSTVGQKILVAVTGLFLCGFLVVHVSGNALLFLNDGGKSFNAYSEFMSTNFFIRCLEILLFTGFVFHILFGFLTWLNNRSARPERYVVNHASETSSFASRWMFFNGSIVFFFLVVHLYSFWVPARFGFVKPSMYKLVSTAFADSLYDAFYIVALVSLAYHLRQGFQSAFQTFGVRPRLLQPIGLAAVIFWLVIPVVFAAMPLYFLWNRYMGGS
jgi:succinate dehydrogenase / fumarate reductase cytochrome b subunit